MEGVIIFKGIQFSLKEIHEVEVVDNAVLLHFKAYGMFTAQDLMYMWAKHFFFYTRELPRKGLPVLDYVNWKIIFPNAKLVETKCLTKVWGNIIDYPNGVKIKPYNFETTSGKHIFDIVSIAGDVRDWLKKNKCLSYDLAYELSSLYLTKESFEKQSCISYEEALVLWRHLGPESGSLLQL
jgi:hypothetical protein